MTMDNLEDLLEPVCEIARAAGRQIEGIRMGGADVEHKEDGSPVTVADRASHDVIADGLAELTPDIALISEEGDVEKDVGGAPFWLVDPLDGTKEFIKGLGEYTVNIALVRQGDPVLGVVYAPALDKRYWAARGAGARVQAATAKPAAIAPRSSGHRTAAISRSHASEETQVLLDKLGVEEVARMGSSLKLCAVADGTADVYPRLGPTYLWDTAAAAAVVREAGAQVYSLDGRPVDYSPRGDLKLPGFIVCAGRQGRVPIEAVLEALSGGA